MATPSLPRDTPKPPLPKASLWRVLKARASTAARLFFNWLEQNGPHWLIAVLAVLTGVVQISPQFVQMRQAVLGILAHGADGLSGLADLAAFPHVIIGIGLMLMVPGLLLQARVAWVLALLLGALSAGLALWATHGLSATFVLSGLLQLALLLYARRFARSSLAASSLFALLGVGSLLIYGTLGSLWFGAGYTPPIHSLPTAFYYAIETMSTVGYGDIVPHTTQARMFTVSMIVLGISIFATTLSVVIGPLIGGSLKRTLEGKMQREQRKNHYVIIGTSSLAYAMWKELSSRGVPVTIIAPSGHPSPFPETADVVTADAKHSDVLELAGVPRAKAVLTLHDDDAENAFAVLAVKELAPGVKTIAGVNDVRHVNKIRRVQPDVLFAPQLLGSQLLARDLFDEPIDNSTVHKLLFPGS
ncbi:MAG: NAD-binding protein [Thiomonas sp.]|uniref:NAD-binding protein n=1 Tax=Thiomonas sp. TaxID=2047785 RepID=UPI002A36455E|nr:NAD-binding protein [Thiomonas sp.]MDY0330262.1 NAD-binding protein [Thiomonas sp.]